MASFKVDLWDKYTDITDSKIKVGKNALKNLESYLKTYVEVQEKVGKTLSKEKFDSKNQGFVIVIFVTENSVVDICKANSLILWNKQMYLM